MNKANVLVCTGNLLLNNDLKRKIYASSTEEFIDSMLWTLEHNCYKKIEQHTKDDVSKEDAKSREILVVDPGECCNSQIADGPTRTTCKLFPICDTNCTIIQDAVSCAFKCLDVEAIDSLILSPSPRSKDSNDSPLRSGTLREWQLAERMVDEGLVKSLGTSDFNLESLRYLFEKIRIKPVSNQISKQMCCSIPVELTEFAEKNSIQLLTHNDRMGMFTF